MTETRIPFGSQTVGPYFRIGLEYLIEQMAETDIEDAIEIRGRVLDRDGAPVPDAMLEFWNAAEARLHTNASQEHGIPDGFRRVGTDMEGRFEARIGRPIANRLEDGRMLAPHAMVLVFARGLQRHLITRVYLEGETGNESDRVLLEIPAERRCTLIAKADGGKRYRWDVILQGEEETVFFAW